MQIDSGIEAAVAERLAALACRREERDKRFLALRQIMFDAEAMSFRGAAADDDAIGLAAWRERLARDHVYAVVQGGEWLAVGGLTRAAGQKLDHKGLVWGMYAVPAARGT
jgi:hypothetical protein